MRTERIRLEDISEAIAGIEGVVSGLEFDDFRTNWMLQRAVERGLEIISEASRSISDTQKRRHSSVPWVQIAGIGNILRHEYHRVEAVVIWNIIQHHLPPLSAAIIAMLKSDDEG